MIFLWSDLMTSQSPLTLPQCSQRCVNRNNKWAAWLWRHCLRCSPAWTLRPTLRWRGNSSYVNPRPRRNLETREESWMPSHTKDLLIKPDSSTVSAAETVSVTPASSGFEYLTFRARKLSGGEKFSDETGECELGIVILGGRCSVESTAGA